VLPEEPQRKTCLSIQDQAFLINGKPTCPGRVYRERRPGEKGNEDHKEYKLEGLLFSAHMVNGIFDDLNPVTRKRWAYADGPWDPERNTREFIKAMPTWRYHGLSAFSLNLQGGSPEGSASALAWQNSAYTRDGRLRADYMKRLEAVLDEADQQGLVVILGLFSPSQDQQVWDERSVVTAVDHVVDWLVDHKYTHVLVEVADACDNRQYDHAILTEARVHELVERVAKRSEGKVDSPAGRLLVSARRVAAAHRPAPRGRRGAAPGHRRRRPRAPPPPDSAHPWTDGQPPQAGPYHRGRVYGLRPA